MDQFCRLQCDAKLFLYQYASKYQPDPIAITTQYLLPLPSGSVKLVIRDIRIGRAQSVVQVEVQQGEIQLPKTCTLATITHDNLAVSPCHQRNFPFPIEQTVTCCSIIRRKIYYSQKCERSCGWCSQVCLNCSSPSACACKLGRVQFSYCVTDRSILRLISTKMLSSHMRVWRHSIKEGPDAHLLPPSYSPNYCWE
jgi:hypothetical protein